jgi:hypothetical protein
MMSKGSGATFRIIGMKSYEGPKTCSSVLSMIGKVEGAKASKSLIYAGRSAQLNEHQPNNLPDFQFILQCTRKELLPFQDVILAIELGGSYQHASKESCHLCYSCHTHFSRTCPEGEPQ